MQARAHRHFPLIRLLRLKRQTFSRYTLESLGVNDLTKQPFPGESYLYLELESYYFKKLANTGGYADMAKTIAHGITMNEKRLLLYNRDRRRISSRI